MRSLFDQDDQEQPKADADLTLGIGSLLSIFFGVLLICGIFFSFGYTIGRRNMHAAPVPAAASQANLAIPPPLPSSTDSTTAKPASPEGTAFPPGYTPPVPDEKQPDAKHPVPSDAAAPKAAKTTHPAPAAQEASNETPALTAAPNAHRTTSPGKPRAGISAPLDTAAADAAPAPGQPIMVQIAAVSRQEDADVLAGALRKRGFNPTVRPGTADKLFHVQVGPFTDKAQADTIKQHLLSDGYNAILK